MAQISLNPMKTTNARNSFGVVSDGLYQGVALDDPANRYNLAAGTVSPDEKKPLWGGLPIAEFLPGTKSAPRGAQIKRAYDPQAMAGLTVFNQAHNGLTTPQSPVPQFASNMTVSYYRFGSNMRVPVKCSASVVSLGTTGASVRSLVAWDFANEQLEVASKLVYTGDAALTGTAGTTENGISTVTLSAAAPALQAGQIVEVKSGADGAGGSLGLVAVLTISDDKKTITIADPTADGSLNGSIQLVAATAKDIALPVKIIEIEAGNSKTCAYDADTNFLTWEENSNCALLLL